MSKNKRTIIVGGIIVFAIFVYMHAFQNETQAQEPLVAPDAAAPSGAGNSQKGREILALLAELKSVRLDESIFSDPMFQSLLDTSVELNPEPKGRPNPFAPLGKDVVLSDDFSGFATTSPRDISFSSATSSTVAPKGPGQKNNSGPSGVIVVPVGM